VVGLTANAALAQKAAQADTHGALPLTGSLSYTLVPDSSGDVKAAIERTVHDMNFITRPIARGRLVKINPVPQRVRIRMVKDTVSAAFDDGNPVVTPLNGDVVPWSNPLTKETDHAHVVASGETVVQFIAAPDGTRENAFVFSADGTRLRLVVTVTSPRLPRALVYELLFRRDSPAS
jgi:hypothetical protein